MENNHSSPQFQQVKGGWGREETKKKKPTPQLLSSIFFLNVLFHLQDKNCELCTKTHTLSKEATGFFSLDLFIVGGVWFFFFNFKTNPHRACQISSTDANTAVPIYTNSNFYPTQQKLSTVTHCGVHPYITALFLTLRYFSNLLFSKNILLFPHFLYTIKNLKLYFMIIENITAEDSWV